jgi:protocatechuate 3,4-dioxygenase beta subunit
LLTLLRQLPPFESTMSKVTTARTRTQQRRRRTSWLAALAFGCLALFALQQLISRRSQHVERRARSVTAARPRVRWVPDAFAHSSSLAGSVRSAAGRAIEHAAVCAVSVNAKLVGSPPNPCVESDARGEYFLDALAPGVYFLRASAAGFEPGVANAGVAVLLTAAQDKAELDFVLRSGGAKVAGSVIDATGGPVAHAFVRAARAPGPSDMVDVETNDDGRFALTISSGSIALTARAAGYADAHSSAVAPASGLTLVLVPESTISGTVVTGKDSQPVAGITVRAVPVGSWGMSAHPLTQTNERGEFALSALKPGAYGLLAEGDHLRGSADGPYDLDVADAIRGAVVVVSPALSVSGSVVMKSNGEACRNGDVYLSQPEAAQVALPTLAAEIDSNGGVMFSSVVPGRYEVRVQCADNVLDEGPRTLEVGAADVSGVVWKVSPGLGLSVRVIDQRELPVPNATFQLQLPGQAGEAPPTMLLTADAKGRYEYPTTLDPGHYVLKPRGTFRGEPVALALEAGMGKVGVTLRFQGSGAINVTVRTRSGEPVEGVTVVAAPLDTATKISPLQRRVTLGRQAAPLGAGRYHIASLEPGRYEVTVEDSVNPPVVAGSVERPAIDVREASEAQAEVVLERGESISGRVVDDAGNPLPNVWVSAIQDGDGDPVAAVRLATMLSGGPGPGQRVLTDLEGRFRLENLVGKTPFAVRAEELHGGVATKRGVRTGDDATLVMAATGVLIGTAVGPKGELSTGSSIQISQVDTGWTRAALVNADGSWKFSNAMSGRLRLSAVDQAGRSAQREVDLGPRQTLDHISLVLQGDSAESAAPTVAQTDKP